MVNIEERVHAYILGWPKRLFAFFCKALQSACSKRASLLLRKNCKKKTPKQKNPTDFKEIHGNSIDSKKIKREREKFLLSKDTIVFKGKKNYCL